MTKREKKDKRRAKQAGKHLKALGRYYARYASLDPGADGAKVITLTVVIEKKSGHVEHVELYCGYIPPNAPSSNAAH
jgi:hypothetical protein